MRGLVYLKKPVDTNDSIKRYNKLNFLRFVIINVTSLANNQKEPAISTKKYVHEIFMGFFFSFKENSSKFNILISTFLLYSTFATSYKNFQLDMIRYRFRFL